MSDQEAIGQTSAPRGRFVVRVQHHAARADLLPPLLESLAPLPTEVVTDDAPQEKSPWRNYRRCLELPLPPETTHLLIIQDDATVCRNFAAALPLVARDCPVVLWLGGQPKRAAHAATMATGAGRHWIDLYRGAWLPAVAVLWPAAVVLEPGAWVDEYPRYAGRQPHRADDGVLGSWAGHVRQRVRIAVPSLVEHPDETPSLIGRKAMGGRNRGRVAAFHVGGGDPLEIDWAD